jgi:hypothetical protein
MRKILWALLCLVLCTLTTPHPPRLGWENGWCWDNVLVQLFYNARQITECLIKNADECRKKNDVLEKYIDLIEAIRKNPDGFFKAEMGAYHKAYCDVAGCEMCKWSSPEKAFDEFTGNLLCCRDLLSFDAYDYGKRKEVCNVGWWSQGEDLAKFIVDNRQKLDHIGTLPVYFFLNVFGTWTRLEEHIDLAPLLIDDLKKIVSTAPYELIGVVMFKNNNHFVAYIKDQWEQNPSWYYCNDMAADFADRAHVKLDGWPESGPWNNEVPRMLLYKLVGADPLAVHEKTLMLRKQGEEVGDDMARLVLSLKLLAAS